MAGMSTMVSELYDALRKAGVEDAVARSAAESVLGKGAGTELVTKADLRAELAELRTLIADMESRVIKWNVGAMAVLTAIMAALSKFVP